MLLKRMEMLFNFTIHPFFNTTRSATITDGTNSFAAMLNHK